jgi:hypothetical protein
MHQLVEKDSVCLPALYDIFRGIFFCICALKINKTGITERNIQTIKKKGKKMNNI